MNRRDAWKWPLTLVTVGLSGCSVVYRPAPFWGAGGYSSTDIDAMTVDVNYLTARSADEGQVRDYALYRCAEIALERGFDGLVVLKAGAIAIPGPNGFTTTANIRMLLFKGAAPQRKDLPSDAQGIYIAAALKSRLDKVVKR